jgi:hypothetical protein
MKNPDRLFLRASMILAGLYLIAVIASFVPIRGVDDESSLTLWVGALFADGVLFLGLVGSVLYLWRIRGRAANPLTASLKSACFGLFPVGLALLAWAAL